MASTKTVRNIQQIIWLYFWLWIFEGALRKWVVPQLSAPLLIVRDPVVIGAYILALKAGIFPKDIFTKSIICLAFLSLLGGLATVIISDNDLTVAIVIFGLRANFLHLPLIFLIPKVFSLDDVKKLGRWVLLLAVPMACLMVYQFSSLPDDFINRGAATGMTQIASAGGKIRPSGTFSFITGAAEYLSLVATFLLYGLFQNKVYPYWLLIISGISIVLGLAVSGSRSALGLVGGVLICLIAGLLVRPALIGKSYKFLVLIGVVYFGISFIPFFDQGIEIFSARVETANSAEASSGGIVSRFFNGFLNPFSQVDRIPLLGFGLGMGTNVGAVLLTGKAQFLLSEGEWGRVIFESGLVLGPLYILLRIALVAWIAGLSIKSAAAGNILPLLFFGNCGILLLNGQFSQSSEVGFTVLASGLCLASTKLMFNNSKQTNENFTSRQLLT